MATVEVVPAQQVKTDAEAEVVPAVPVQAVPVVRIVLFLHKPCSLKWIPLHEKVTWNINEFACFSVVQVAEDIMAVSGLFIKQQIELLEVMTGFETQNKYKVWKCVFNSWNGWLGHEIPFF